MPASPTFAKSMFPMPTSRLLAAASLTLLLAACGSVPAPSRPTAPALPPVEQHSADLGGNIRLDYQIERKISGLNGRTCYAFITGHLVNGSGQTLGRRTVIDINVFGQGRQLFRDLTSPVADVPPGGRVMFEMVDSPVHKEGCPAYDRIEIGLRKAAPV